VTITPQGAFDPAQVRIASGQAVLWVNAGRTPQTVTFDPSHVAEPGQVQLPGVAHGLIGRLTVTG
jgi:plastocyanin